MQLSIGACISVAHVLNVWVKFSSPKSGIGPHELLDSQFHPNPAFSLLGARLEGEFIYTLHASAKKILLFNRYLSLTLGRHKLLELTEGNPPALFESLIGGSVILGLRPVSRSDLLFRRQDYVGE